MEAQEYALEIMVREKLDEARAATARRALVVGARPPRVPLRARVGAALITLGERLRGTTAPRAGTPAPRESCATPSTSRG